MQPLGITPEERADADEALAWANEHSPVTLTWQLMACLWTLATIISGMAWNAWVLFCLYGCCMILQLMRANQLINHAFAFTSKLIALKSEKPVD